VKGTVEVRRLGETKYAAAKADTQVYGGDVVRTGENATATVTLADESVIEVAEVSTIGIASRHGSADPSSSAAVLSGVARFSVSPRAPGEGAFRVYTPGAVILKGSTFGVGVAGSGEARVGVETGAVDVIGLAALDAKPVTVEGGASVVLAANGDVGSPSPWPTNDWGTWRDGADAKIVTAALDAHPNAMTKPRPPQGRLRGPVGERRLGRHVRSECRGERERERHREVRSCCPRARDDRRVACRGNSAQTGTVDAVLATDLYVRHPAQVEAQWTVIAPSVDAAVLWPKRFEVTAVGYLDPLRMQYYVHHPRGRIHAPLVGITVPVFYAKVTVPEIDGERVRGRVKTKIWLAPDVQFAATTRPVWVSTPSIDWRVKVKVAPPPMRGNVTSTCVRRSSRRILVGANATGSWASKLTVAAPEPRMNLRAAWSIPVGVKVVVGAPDLAFAAKARAGMKVDAGARVDARARIDAPPPPDVNVKAKIKAKVDVRVPEVKMPSVKAKIGIGIGGGAGAGAGGGGAAAGAGVKAKAGAAVKVKAPEVKAPSVKVKGEAKGKIKLGL
jgi:hypothetical protein